jgi:uncharacterized membrane protein
MKIQRVKVSHLGWCVFAALTLSFQAIAHQRYQVVVLPPDGGADSFEAGYLFYAPLNPSGTVGVSADTTTSPGAPVNSYIWTDGRRTQLQQLPSLPDWTGTSTYINWINAWGLSAGYAVRTNTVTGGTAASAVIWFPDGKIYDIQPAGASQSHAVWVNDLGQVSGWTENSTADACSFGSGAQTAGFIWQFGVSRPLGSLGGLQSYGEFINNRGQVSGHAETSTANSDTGCPPYDPFIWQHGKITDINPGNFGGSQGGTNFLSNAGYAVGFGNEAGEINFDPFLWHEGRLTNLNSIGTLGGGGGSAFNVNDRGDTVGINLTADDSAMHAVLWRDGTFTDLLTLTGDDCSQPYRINNRDQIVGFSFSCATFAGSAFIYEDGEMVDLNALIPADAEVQLEAASWINDDGVISAQAVLTAGSSAGDSRAVLLIPVGVCDPGELQSAAVRVAAARLRSADAADGTKSRPALLSASTMWRRPASPAQLRRAMHTASQ